MSITFLNPWILLLLSGLPLLWFMARRPVNKTQLFLRGLLLALVVVALAKPIMFSQGQDKFHILVLDVSESLSDEQKEKALVAFDNLVVQISSKDSYKAIILGNKSAMSDRTSLAEAIFLPSPTDTSLSTALKEAVENIPLGRQAAITLISDGKATDNNWAGVMQSIQGRGIPVHVIDMNKLEEDVYLSGLSSKDKLREGQTARLLVDVSGSGSSLQIELYSDNKLLLTSQEFDSDGFIQVALDVEPEISGFATFKAKLIVPDETIDVDKNNNEISTIQAVAPPLRLLYLGERQQGGAEKLQLLLGRGFKVSGVDGQAIDESFPLENYDLVVIDDRPALSLSNAFQQNLERAVKKNGLGVFYAGGRSSFGEGGYVNTPLEKILPVRFQQKDETKDPSVSLAIVIDTSGSMQGKPLELAKHFAKLAIGGLKPHDMVGIVEFYGNKQWAAPLQSAANKVELERAVGRMQASGSTSLYPAVEEAYYGLKNMKTRFKHLLILIDGDMGGDDYEPIVRSMAKDGITVSTVLLGQSSHNQEMFDVASWGRGRFYTVGSRFSLVDLLFKQEQKNNMPAYNEGAHNVLSLTGAGWLGDVDTIPNLLGYVETELKTGSELLLAEEKTGHPLLASWRIGLGRVTSFMSEPLGGGTSDWLSWPSYGAMLGRVLSRTALDIAPFVFDVSRSGRDVVLNATLTTNDRNLVPVAWLLGQPEGQTELSFRQRSPSVFQASFKALPKDPVLLEVASVPSGSSSVYEEVKNKILIASNGSEVMSAEHQVGAQDMLDLGYLSEVTGGQVLDKNNLILSSVFSEKDEQALSGTKLWHYLLLLALIIYITELLYRRWPSERNGLSGK